MYVNTRYAMESDGVGGADKKKKKKKKKKKRKKKKKKKKKKCILAIHLYYFTLKMAVISFFVIVNV